MSPRNRILSLLQHCAFVGGEEASTPQTCTWRCGKSGTGGEKKMKGQSGRTTSQSHLMLLLWVSPALVVCQALRCRQGLL